MLTISHSLFSEVQLFFAGLIPQRRTDEARYRHESDKEALGAQLQISDRLRGLHPSEYFVGFHPTKTTYGRSPRGEFLGDFASLYRSGRRVF